MTTQTGLATERIRFTCNEAAELLEISPNTLKRMVRQELIKPVKRGGPGRGHQHIFDLPHMCGLVYLVGFNRETGATRSTIKVFMDPDRLWSLSAIEHALGLRDDAWSEEALAKALRPTPPEPWQIDPETGKRIKTHSDHPDDEAIVREAARLWGKLRKAVLVKLGHTDRITRSVADRTK